MLGDFKAAGELPEMVQVGNEITNGMIWPLGKLPSADNGKTLASFVASGLKAVHDTDAGIKTMIHIDKGGDNAASRTFYDQLINTNGVKDFDVIGLSYYPFWHGNMQQMQANINDLAARYGKDVVIVETAFGYTNENFDDTKNPYDAQAERVGGFRSTVQGQATGLRTVMQSLANVPGGKGIGMFYWEPDWYAVPGAFKDKGDEWDNLVMFDNSGKALESWKVFTDVSDQSLPTIAPKFKEADGVTAEAGVGAAAEDDARDVTRTTTRRISRSTGRRPRPSSMRSARTRSRARSRWTARSTPSRHLSRSSRRTTSSRTAILKARRRSTAGRSTATRCSTS